MEVTCFCVTFPLFKQGMATHLMLLYRWSFTGEKFEYSSKLSCWSLEAAWGEKVRDTLRTIVYEKFKYFYWRFLTRAWFQSHEDKFFTVVKCTQRLIFFVTLKLIDLECQQFDFISFALVQRTIILFKKEYRISKKAHRMMNAMLPRQ